MTQSKALPTAYRSCPVGELEEIERINVGEVLFDRTGKPCPLWVKSTSMPVQTMSALPPKAGIPQRDWHVRFVLEADIANSISSCAEPSFFT